MRVERQRQETAIRRSAAAWPTWWWVVPVVVLVPLLPLLVTGSYRRHLLVLICIYLTLTVSYNLIVGFTGYLTLAHNTFFGIGAYTSAIVAVTYGHHYLIGILCGLALTAVLSGGFGWLLFSRLKGFTFSIVTLGLAITAYVIVLNWVAVTRGPMGIPGIARPSVSLGPTVLTLVQPLHYYYVGLCLVAGTLVISHVVATSRPGRALLAIRENERLAEALGVHALKYKLFVFVVASVLASLAGSFYAHYITVATPEVFWTFWITGLLAMLIVGGPSSNVIGIIIGTILLVVIPEVLRLAEGFRELLYGLALLSMILLMPQGIGGWLESVAYKRRLKRWRSLQSNE